MNLFKNVYIINLKERADRKKNITNELLKNDIKLFNFVEGIKPSINDVILWNKEFCSFNNNVSYKIGSFGCLMSHLKIYKHCINNNINNVIILEDDAYFSENFNKNVINNEIIKYINEDNFGILYFGCTHSVKPKHIEKNIYKCIFSHTTHAYMISLNCMKYILENIKGYDREIDMFLAKVIQKKFNCYCYYPSIIKQTEGYSNIQNKEVKYNM